MSAVTANYNAIAKFLVPLAKAFERNKAATTITAGVAVETSMPYNEVRISDGSIADFLVPQARALGRDGCEVALT